MEINEITGSIVDAAMKVHTGFGPGLVRKSLREVLKTQTDKAGTACGDASLADCFVRRHQNRRWNKIDLLVEGCVIVELQVVEQFSRFAKPNCSCIKTIQ